MNIDRFPLDSKINRLFPETSPACQSYALAGRCCAGTACRRRRSPLQGACTRAWSRHHRASGRCREWRDARRSRPRPRLLDQPSLPGSRLSAAARLHRRRPDQRLRADLEAIRAVAPASTDPAPGGPRAADHARHRGKDPAVDPACHLLERRDAGAQRSRRPRGSRDLHQARNSPRCLPDRLGTGSPGLPAR